MHRKSFLRIAFLCAISSASLVRGGSISIVNAGFEDPATINFNNGPITGWTIDGPGGAGVWNINADPLGYWNVPAPEGNQIAFLSGSSTAPVFPASISQTLGTTLSANTVYSLTGEVGHPIGFGASTGTVYTAELLAGGNVLASTSGSGPEGLFSSFLVTFDSTGSAFVGQALEIRLSSNKAQTGFDAIALNTPAVPEPTSLVMLSAGTAIGAGLARRRKAEATTYEV